MAEIALRTTERRCQKAKSLAWRPIGSTIICQSDAAIRRKWLEIACDLISPAKRKHYTMVPGYDELCDAWSPALYEAWLEAGRPTTEYPLGRLLQDTTYAQTVWDAVVKPLGVQKRVPLASESDKSVCDAWPWSLYERCNYFIVVNTDASDAEVESWQGDEERHDDKGNLVIIWRTVVEYETDIGLTASTLTKIASADTVVNPRFDKPVAKAKFIQLALAVALEEL